MLMPVSGSQLNKQQFLINLQLLMLRVGKMQPQKMITEFVITQTRRLLLQKKKKSKLIILFAALLLAFLHKSVKA